LGGCFRFPTCCFVSEPLAPYRLALKMEFKLRTFGPVKFSGKEGQISESILRVKSRTKPLLYFRRGVSQPSGRLVWQGRLHKGQWRQTVSVLSQGGNFTTLGGNICKFSLFVLSGIWQTACLSIS